jgi:hypothetical protein
MEHVFPVFGMNPKVYGTGLNCFWCESKVYGTGLNHFWCKPKVALNTKNPFTKEPFHRHRFKPMKQV